MSRNLTTTSIDEYFGIALVTVLPPRGLLLPVLPIRLGNTTHFTLFPKCSAQTLKNGCPHPDSDRLISGVYTTVELDVACKYGYVILKIHKIWHYPIKGKQLFEGFIKEFMKIKAANSGWPSSCINYTDKQEYLKELSDKDDIELKFGYITDNPAKRFVGKMLMNVLW